MRWDVVVTIPRSHIQGKSPWRPGGPSDRKLRSWETNYAKDIAGRLRMEVAQRFWDVGATALPTSTGSVGNFV